MTMQEEKEKSLDYLLKSLDAIMLIPMNNWHTTSEVIKKAMEKYENEIKEAFEKGYEEGCLKGYNDHVKLTNTLYK